MNRRLLTVTDEAVPGSEQPRRRSRRPGRARRLGLARRLGRARWTRPPAVALAALATVAGALIGPVNAAEASTGTLGPAALAQGVRPEDGVFRVTGHGWGHGRGMSQWGAFAAAKAGRTYPEILRFYYPGTKLVARSTPAQIRVLLSHDLGAFRVRPEPGLTLWWTNESGQTRPVRLPVSYLGCRVSTWRVRAVYRRDMAVDAYTCGRWHAYVGSGRLSASGRASFVATDGKVQVERQLGDGTRIRRGYRGFVRVVLRSGRVRPVNVVPYEDYLRSVVPAESPASWPRAALRAQTIAARSYAVRSSSNRSSSYYDVYDTSASQVYPGMVGYGATWNVIREYEFAGTNEAIKATRGMTLRYANEAAFTEFGSSNGGWTADGGLPYLRAAQDGWDSAATANPYRTWTDTVSARSLRNRYPSIGTIVEIRVAKRSGGGRWGGRVSRLLIIGSSGTQEIRGEDRVRSVLGLRSAYFAFGS
ncbi:SpoIID/LytB domain-containing protein [Actinopolymorpha sp. B11F2]|uniref:SpoIID/LytB domain-containing protein n=1 Tax=Actinopolymorpha sp. B11F2 TaxID=3160862 RepID=UPI0032E3938D